MSKSLQDSATSSAGTEWPSRTRNRRWRQAGNNRRCKRFLPRSVPL